MSFTRESIEAVGDRWSDVEPFNQILDELRAARLPAVLRIGDAAISKVVWKIRGFAQVSLYRTVMLADGCADSWGRRNTLTSILCARALVETTALIFDFATRLKVLCDKADFTSIDQLVMNRTFATRLPEWLPDSGFAKSINVLTFIDQLAKTYKGIRGHYDRLSEICHPNYGGLQMMFAELDTDLGILNLDDRNLFNNGLLSHVLGGYMCIGVVERYLDEIEGLLPRVLELSEADRMKGNT